MKKPISISSLLILFFTVPRGCLNSAIILVSLSNILSDHCSFSSKPFVFSSALAFLWLFFSHFSHYLSDNISVSTNYKYSLQSYFLPGYWLYICVSPWVFVTSPRNKGIVQPFNTFFYSCLMLQALLSAPWVEQWRNTKSCLWLVLFFWSREVIRQYTKK